MSEEEQVDNMFGDSTYKSLMFYNTTIRNVGLYTSIAVALLGYATRLKGDKSKATKFFFLLASTAFLSIAIYLNYIMYNILHEYRQGSAKNQEDLKPWMNISMVIFPIHAVIFAMIVGYFIMNIGWHIKKIK